MVERRHRSRLPLKLILLAILATSALWLAELYMMPTWDKIRSFVLDQSRIKDMRTGVEISNTQKVLDGVLDAFIEASLKQRV